MKRGFSIPQIIFLAIIAIVIFKVVIPKLNSVKEGTLGIAYANELEGVMKGIKEDYFIQGRFRELKSVTFSRQFEEADLNSPIKLNKPIKFGVGVKEKGNMVFCTTITLKQDKNTQKYYLELKDEETKREVCQEFHKTFVYQKLKHFDLQ